MPRYNLDQAIEQLRKADPKAFDAFYATVKAFVNEYGPDEVDWVLEHIVRARREEESQAASV